MATLNFDARTVAPQVGFDALPVGWYNVIVDESEMKPTKAGDGAYLKVRYSILDGAAAGRKIFGNINLQNNNPQAVEIGLKQLSALAHAVGVLLVQDSQQLHNIPLKIKLKIRTDKSGEYEPQNDITQWKNINEPTEASIAGVAGTNGMVLAQPAGQPAAAPSWQQPAPAAAPAQPAWAGAPAPAAAAPSAAPAGAPSWQQPAAQQPWQAPAAAPAQQPAAAPAAAPTGFNPNGAVPPWAAR